MEFHRPDCISMRTIRDYKTLDDYSFRRNRHWFGLASKELAERQIPAPQPIDVVVVEELG